VDFRHPSFGADSIEPDLKPMRQQEATVGLEHQFSNVIALNARYVHKQIDRFDLGINYGRGIIGRKVKITINVQASA